MIHDAPVYLTGYVATEPTFKKVTGDISSAKVRVAYTARRQNRETGEWEDGATTFVNVQCWRQLADNVATCLRKGEPVLVMGRLRIRRYDDTEGNSRTAVEVEANSVGHDLSRGVAHFSRARRSAGGTAADAAVRHAAAALDAGGVPELSEQPPAAANGAAVVDEQAVAEFAKELSALGAAAVAGAEPGPAEGAGAESMPSAQS